MKTTKMSQPMIPDDYAAQDDLNTLLKGEEIRQDGKRHKKAIAHGMKKISQINSIADLKKAVKAKREPDSEAGEPYDDGDE